MKIYPQVLKNVRVTDKKLAMGDADVKAAIAAAEERLGGDGRVLVRESGTEPLVRVMSEAGTEEICAREVESIIKVIKQKGYEA